MNTHVLSQNDPTNQQEILRNVLTASIAPLLVIITIGLAALYALIKLGIEFVKNKKMPGTNCTKPVNTNLSRVIFCSLVVITALLFVHTANFCLTAQNIAREFNISFEDVILSSRGKMLFVIKLVAFTMSMLAMIIVGCHYNLMSDLEKEGLKAY